MTDCKAIIKKLKKRDKENRKKLHTLLEITRLVSSLLHTRHVLDAIVRFLAKEYQFDACAILLLDEKGDLNLTSKTGKGDDFVDKVLKNPTVNKFIGDCVEKKEILLDNDTKKNAAVNGTHSPEPEGMRSFAVSPIIVEEEILGVLLTVSQKKNYFHEKYFDAIIIVVSQIGMAIKISQLYDEVYDLSQNLQEKVDEKTSQLEEANKRLIEAERHALLGKMANRVAHDLRNSLTVVGGFAQRLAKKIPPDDPNRKYVDIIIDEVSKLEKKVNKIVDIKNSHDLI